MQVKSHRGGKAGPACNAAPHRRLQQASSGLSSSLLLLDEMGKPLRLLGKGVRQEQLVVQIHQTYECPDRRNAKSHAMRLNRAAAKRSPKECPEDMECMECLNCQRLSTAGACVYAHIRACNAPRVREISRVSSDHGPAHPDALPE